MKEEDVGRRTFSFEGEDILINKIFADYLRISKGFYVDVGAHHPLVMSNTHYLYKAGWRGINIDAMPGSMGPFNHFRPDDINIECGVSEKPGVMKFSMFAAPALNGFLEDSMVASHVARGQQLVGQTDVATKPLRDILAETGVTTPIDFMNVDAEGLDLEVLRSNDFGRWRPKVLMVEILGCSDIRSVLNSDVAKYVESLGYRLFSRLHLSSIFVDTNLVR